MVIIRSKAEFNYCPVCGRETEKKEIPISRGPDGKPMRTNLKVTCPEHGELQIS